MHPDCVDAVEEALGRPLKQGEDQKLEDAVNLHMRIAARKNPSEWLKMAPYDRLQAGAQAAVQGLVADLKLKQQRVQLQIAAHDRIENALNDAFEKLPENAKPGEHLRVVSQMLAFDSKAKGMVSAETWQHSIRNEAFGNLLPLWGSVKGNFFGLFESREGVRSLVKELYGEDSGSAEAKAGAQAWTKVTDELRDRANAAGMDIGKLDEWHYPQNHSQGRIAQAGIDKWVGDTMPLLDRDKYINSNGTRMSDEQVSSVLHGAYDSIITDGMNKVAPGQARGYGMVANRNSQHRAIFFKDADSYLTYHGEYGDRSLWPTLTGHINKISRDIGLTETLGPNAEQTFKYFNDRTLTDELRMDPTAANKLKSKAAFNESLYDVVSGKTRVVNQAVADAFQTFRNFEVGTKLGGVAITALGDEAGMAATAFANHVPWTGTFMREFKYLNPANAEDRAVAMHSGLGINGFIGSINRFGTEDFQLGGSSKLAATRDVSSKIAGSVLRASGAEAMWDARRQALGSVLMSYVGKVTREHANFADINQQDHGMLATKGVTENDWKVWQLAQPEDWGASAHTVLTPKAIQAIPDADLAKLGDPTALRRHASTMLLGHVLEETGMGVMDTGARERARMGMAGESGTARSELWRSAMLFKGFGASMIMKHWSRAASMPTAGGTWGYGARLVTIGTAAGALALQINNLRNGKDPANIEEPRFWGEALLKGGGFGFYGDFFYSELTGHDTSFIPAVAGPIETEAEQVWNLTGGAMFKHARGERTDEGANLLRFARSEIPFLNMWYTKAAMDHILWNDMQEAVSPGYLDRMQARAADQRGTSWYWGPQEGLPHAGPDFAKMFQPERGEQQLAQLGRYVGLSEPTSE